MYLDQVKKGVNHWWRYLLAIVSLGVGYALGQVPLYIFFFWKKGQLGMSDTAFEEAMQTLNYAALGVSDNLFFCLIMPPFVLALLAIVVVFPRLFQRPLLSFVTSRNKLDVSRIVFGAGLWFGLATLFLFIFLPKEAYHYNFDAPQFLVLALLAIVLLPLQVATEELVFRGILFQGLYKLVKNRWIAFGVVTLAFGLVHGSNPEMQAGFWKVMPAYLMMSALFGWVTLKDGGLELALGLHMGNNLLVALVMSTADGALNTPSIYKTTVGALMEILPALLVVMSLISLAMIWWRYWRPSSVKKVHTKPV